MRGLILLEGSSALAWSINPNKTNLTIVAKTKKLKTAPYGYTEVDRISNHLRKERNLQTRGLRFFSSLILNNRAFCLILKNFSCDS